jgi:integration host factor subunit alpha
MTSDVSMKKMDEAAMSRAKASTSQVAALQTVTRVDLAEAVYRRVGLSRKESAVLVEMVLSEMIDRLAVGETVKLSSFGSFIVRDKGERVGRNPKTGVEVPIMQRRVLVFKPSNVLKALMNGEELPDDDG